MKSEVRRRPLIEWPTVFLAFVIYGGWALLTKFHALVPDFLLFVLGGWFIAWHSSFQHEIVHGHPTRWKSINNLFGYPPLSLWLPFDIYRVTHRLHHRDDKLTDPLNDPESKYLTKSQWSGLSSLGRAIEAAQTPLLGRILIGPFWIIGKFLFREADILIRGDRSHLKIWLVHVLTTAAVLAWIVAFCGMSVEKYILFFVYPGTAILMLRSFAEHRAASKVTERTAIIENASVLGLVFLNNNLHSVHHRFPAAAWYQLPVLYKKNRDGFIADNASLVYNGYGEIILRFLFKAHDQIVHPISEVVSPAEIA